MEYTKKDDDTLSLVETSKSATDYTRDQLEARLASIQQQQDADNARHEAEKQEVEVLIKKCDELGIV